MKTGISDSGLNLTHDRFNKLLIPIAPLNEQKRIVVRIEELFSELDNGIKSLKTAREQLKVYRQAVLKHAFEGKLTTDWRKRDSEYSCPNQVMVKSDILANLPLLPESWNWQKFEEIAEVASNLVEPSLYPNAPHIAPDNIERESGKLLSYRSISEDKVFSPKHKFSQGQIIYSKIRPYLSKLIIAPFEGLCSADMYPINTKLNTRYLYFFMLTTFFVNKASTAGSRTILPKINKKELSQIPIPICPKEEQELIVSRIEQLLTIINRFEDDISQQLSKSEALRQSILKTAFSGELVAQDANDEPISVLLERIRDEKKSHLTNNKSKHQKGANSDNEYAQDYLIEEAAV